MAEHVAKPITICNIPLNWDRDCDYEAYRTAERAVVVDVNLWKGAHNNFCKCIWDYCWCLQCRYGCNRHKQQRFHHHHLDRCKLIIDNATVTNWTYLALLACSMQSKSCHEVKMLEQCNKSNSCDEFVHLLMQADEPNVTLNF